MAKSGTLCVCPWLCGSSLGAVYIVSAIAIHWLTQVSLTPYWLLAFGTLTAKILKDTFRSPRPSALEVVALAGGGSISKAFQEENESLTVCEATARNALGMVMTTAVTLQGRISTR